jgi:putative integral membrane protein (TIGR02587 family)
MWNIGTYLGAAQLLGMLALTFAAVLALAHVSGFRSGAGRDHLEIDLEEAFEAMAVGAVGSVVVLVTLGRLGPTDPPDQWIRLIAIQTVPLSIGAALGNALLADNGSLGSESGNSRSSEARALLTDVAATAFGAFFLAFNIAPTEEVQLVASDASLMHLVAIIVLSLVIAYGVVFEAEFVGIGRRRAQAGPFQRPITETTLSYCVSLGVAAAMLLLLGRMEIGDPIRDVVAQTVVLGLPAAIGGAAGRLVV